jgi:hypothetical protein
LVPAPGQSTQLDEAADDLITAEALENQAPEETEASAITHDVIETSTSEQPAHEPAAASECDPSPGEQA